MGRESTPAFQVPATRFQGVLGQLAETLRFTLIARRKWYTAKNPIKIRNIVMIHVN